jgi:hypothetical protein
MSEEIIRDSAGRTIGFIQKMSGGRRQAYDVSRQLLGCYNETDCVTKHVNGRMVAKGDVLSGLIFGRRG